ncbi:MAG: sulfite exporter TauE/SafE family protein [Solirubrobacteraceae bacterium]|nr:sulfite exporter TauE/SafE family protein [Solirubrobacteraceae bacterium]
MSTAPQPEGRSGSTANLLAIGTAAGIYSGLFGVGGGAVMVPLLILWRGMDPRVAAATSLAAIIVIAAAGTAAHAAYGNVHWDAALMVAVPAVAGALIGTALQQRVRREWVSLGLALLLVVGAIDLLRGAA